MQQQGRVLAPLNLDSPKLNVTTKLHGKHEKKNMIKEEEEEPQPSAAQIHKSTNAHSNKAFRLSPSKDSFFDSLSPLRTQPAPSFNILEGTNNVIEEENDSYILKKLEAEDLCNINKDLIEEIENLQKELDEKDRVIHMKSIKLDELIHVNNNLLDELKQEREISESDFNSWLVLKSELEFEIHALRKAFSSTKEIPQDSKSVELENFSKFQSMQVEINKLKKRVNVLMKENELESQSKMMIIDELEMMKGRYLEIETKHLILKQDYDDLVKELLTIKQYENEYMSYDDVSPVVTPTLNDSTGNGKFESLNSLNIKKKRPSSYDNYSTYDDNYSRISSMRNASLNKAIREVELKAQRQKYQHEIMMYEFENKSLKLQNEKLLSFIGFSLQVKSKDFKTLANKISTSNFDYSDSSNIKSARKNLKSVIKSVSALPMRPATVGDSISISDMKQSSTNENVDDFMNNSMNNSMEYSTDYEHGEMLPLELGASDSFEEYGDDELDEDECDEEDEGKIGENLLSLNDTSDFLTEPKNTFNGKKNFSSTSSLDVVYKMDRLFQAPNSTSIDNGHQFPPLTPRNHVKRLTPSTFNLKNDIEKDVKENTNVIENKDFVDDNAIENDSFGLDFDNANIILMNNKEDKMRLRSSSMKNLSSMCSLSQIREEEDDDIKYDGGDSSFEDDDDGDADETINISNAEIDMFKIDMPRRLKCPKHSTFMCFTCSGPLIDPQVLQYQISPIYSLMRRFTSRNNSESSIEQLKWMSKMITGDHNKNKCDEENGNGSRSPNKKSRERRVDKRELLRHQLYKRRSSGNEEVGGDSCNESGVESGTSIGTMLDLMQADFKYHAENID